VPHRANAEALLARWREAERRHASTPPGTPEFEESLLAIDHLRRSYQRAVEEAQELDPFVSQPVVQPAE
jgi:hypothetical protein